MKNKNILIFALIASGCGSLSVKLSEKAKNLKNFNNRLSKYVCRPTKTFTVSNEGIPTSFGKRSLKHQLLNIIASQTNANYVDQDEFESNNSIVKSELSGNGYKCDFKDVALLSEAVDVSILKSDHIAVNCKRTGGIVTDFYHDESKMVENFLKNTVHEKGGNVGNIERTKKAGLRVGVYSCDMRQLAQARIDMREEDREEMKVRNDRIRNFYLDEQNRTTRGAYNLLQLYILNESF